MQRRVVVTGLGAVTPIGNNVPDFWDGLINGNNGVDLITRFDTSKFTTKFAAEVKNFDPGQFIERKSLSRLDPFTQFAISAADMALQDSKIDLSKITLERFGVLMGSGIGGIKALHDQFRQYYLVTQEDPKKISPFFITMLIADIAPGYISIKYHLKGPNYATTSACASGSHAIADAFMLIQRGNADIMFCGGTEAAISEMGIGGFSTMRALSGWNDRYKEASRPFDKERNGFVMGEGAGVLIIEELEHALNRGANIYCELAGVGLTGDGFHITAPDPSGYGAQRSMKEAVEDAKLTLNDIDYINAHGTSTPLNDVTESNAIKSVFGEHAYSMVVSSIKSMTGHLLGAAGGVEAIATVLTVQNDIIPPTINYTTPDPECDLNYSPNVATKKVVNAAISNTFGFGGHNASILFKKFKE
ncbi:MAG: beta-ketoacyl-ACP synthase II [Ignavibacteriaceae bacterium]